MQPLSKALKTAKIEQRPWRQELNRFLLQYRTSPHCSTRVPPAELLFNRTVKGQLPVLQKKSNVNRHKEARRNERKRQEYNRKYRLSCTSQQERRYKAGRSRARATRQEKQAVFNIRSNTIRRYKAANLSCYSSKQKRTCDNEKCIVLQTGIEANIDRNGR